MNMPTRTPMSTPMNKPMKKTLVPLVVLALTLAACAAPGRGRDDRAAYDLGPSPAPIAPVPTAVGLVLDVRLPAWLDTPAIAYRLAYAEPQRLRHYTQARWAAPPAALLQQRLRQSLALAAGGAPCTLRVELDAFSQIFDTPTASRVELRGEALLLVRKREALRLPIRIEHPASPADAAGGAAAFAAAGDALAATLAGWLREQDLAGCHR